MCVSPAKETARNTAKGTDRVTIIHVIDLQLSVILLGTPVVKWGEQVIHIQRKIPRALLYYLAGHPQPIRRDELCLLLWPDASPTEGRRHLRGILSKLRAELPLPEALRVEQGLVSLDMERVWVDLLEFTSLLNTHRRLAGMVPRNEPLPEPVYQGLLRAVEIWQGPRFLFNFEWPDSELYEQWASETSHLVDVGYQFCLLRLADHASACGDLERGLGWLQKAATLDPSNSDLHFRILTNLLEIGKPEEISNYCNYLKVLYEDQGGPPASLLHLCHKIQTSGKAPTQPRIQWPPVVTLRVPMTGRLEELQRLRQACIRGGSAVLLGESGAGKTRLSYEFFRQQDPLPRLMLVDCQEHERSLPFQALISSLRQGVHPDEWQHLDRTWQGHLAALLPELIVLFPHLGNSRSNPQGDARPQIFEAYFQLMSLLAKNRRVFYILEDVQWCDGATRAAVEYLLGRGFFRPPNFLIINARLEALEPDVRHFLDHPQRGVPSLKINLPLLQPDDIQEIGLSILGEKLPPEMAEKLKVDTGGNPLYVIEWLRASSLHRSLQPGDSYSQPSMGGLLNLMRERFHSLNSSSRQVLAAAAILGSQFSPAQVQVVASLSEDQITAALEELEQLHLIRPASQGRLYSFIHDKIREVILMDLSLARKHMLHLRAARLLKSDFEGFVNPNSARVAEHYEAGGEPVPAIYAWVAAAKHALHLYSMREAEEAFQQAEKLVKSFWHNLPDETILHLYQTWGFLALQSANLKEARRIFSQLLRLGEQRQNRIMMGVALTGLAQVHYKLGEMADAQRAANQSVLMLDTLPDLWERINALYTRAIVLTILTQHEAARQDLELVISLSARATEDAVIEIRSLSTRMLAITYCLNGQPQRAAGLAETAYQDALKINAPFPQVNALAALAMAAFYSFDYAASSRWLDEGMKISQAHQFWHLLGYLHVLRSLLHLSRGYLDQCWKELQILHSIAVEHRCEDLLPSEWLIRGQIHRFLRNFPAALECLRQGESLSFDSQNRLELLAQQAAILGMSGEYEQSDLLFTEVLRQAKQAGLGIIYYPALSARLGALAPILPADQLKAEIEELPGLMEDCKIPEVHEFLHFGLALAYLKVEKLDLALEHAASFQQYASNCEIPWLKILNFTLHTIMTRATGQTIDEGMRQATLATLQFLDAQIQHPDLRPDFETFRGMVLEQLS